MNFILFIVSGFGSGYLPKMPGTYGSIVGLILTYLLLLCGFNTLLIAFLFTTLIGWYFSQKILEQDQTDPDPSFIVIDEIAGIMLTVLLVLCGIQWIYQSNTHLQVLYNWSPALKMTMLILAFLAFRFFDILKPTPIWQIEHYMTTTPKLWALGIMLDDLLAATYAAIVVIPIIIYLSF